MLGEIYSANLIKEKGGGWNVKDGNSCNDYISLYSNLFGGFVTC